MAKLALDFLALVFFVGEAKFLSASENRIPITEASALALFLSLSHSCISAREIAVDDHGEVYEAGTGTMLEEVVAKQDIADAELRTQGERMQSADDSTISPTNTDTSADTDTLVLASLQGRDFLKKFLTNFRTFKKKILEKGHNFRDICVKLGYEWEGLDYNSGLKDERGDWKTTKYMNCGDTVHCFMELILAKKDQTHFFESTADEGQTPLRVYKYRWAKARASLERLGRLLSDGVHPRVFQVYLDWAEVQWLIGPYRELLDSENSTGPKRRDDGTWATGPLPPNVSDEQRVRMTASAMWRDHIFIVVKYSVDNFSIIQGYIGKHKWIRQGEPGATFHDKGYGLRDWVASDNPFAAQDGFDIAKMNQFLGLLQTYLENGILSQPGNRVFSSKNHAAMFGVRDKHTNSVMGGEKEFNGIHYMPDLQFHETQDDHIGSADRQAQSLKALLTGTAC